MRFFARLHSRLALVITSLALTLFALNCHADNELSSANIYGTNFTISVPNVAAGDYTAILGFMETEAAAPGQRLFDIEYAGHLIASNLDVFSAAGGTGKPYFLTVPVKHAADLEGGPLAFKFIARRDQAIFNSLELKNTSGARIFLIKSTDVMNPQDREANKIPEISGPFLWKDPSQPIDVRARDLVSRLSLAEKVAQLRNGAPPISRLGIPAYDYWSECLHGVGRAGVATVFPQAIGMAATWDAPLVHEVADTIATEARAKHNAYAQLHSGDSVRYVGLTFWTPNINLFRDPRWGRGQETYGEDPFLTSQMAVAFIRGLQGEDLPRTETPTTSPNTGTTSPSPIGWERAGVRVSVLQGSGGEAPKYLKAMACAKHFAVHSGPEPIRQNFNAQVSERDLFDSYLPQFEAAVRQGHVGAVMGAYNEINGEPACSNPFFLNDLLRQQWGFDGHVVSDCGAIGNIFENYQLVPSPEAAAARALKAGCDLCCGTTYNSLVRAAMNGLVDPHQIDTAVQRVLTARFRLGLFDPPGSVPYSQIPASENDSPAHAQLALRTACESIVLLKNDGVLPLDRRKLKRIAVIGTNAVSVSMMLGDYNGTPSQPVTILDGIKSVAGSGIEVLFDPGCPLALPSGTGVSPVRTNAPTTSKAIELAKTADFIIYVGGLSPDLEGEEMTVDADGFFGGDRTRIELPTPQTDLLKALHATGKPVVFVNCSGGAVAMPWETKNLPAILQAWYPGQAGGRAVAEILFGDANPAGRLPVTVYSSTEDLPAFEDYSMTNRTYRYFNGTPEFAFGHGLSYTHFDYAKPKLEPEKISATGTLNLSFTIKNTGSCDGDEVTQVYYHRKNSEPADAKESLCAFARVHLVKQGTTTVLLPIPAERFRHWSTSEKRYVVEPGAYELLIGSASDDIRARVPVEVTVPE
jgi:beta-glucosidase